LKCYVHPQSDAIGVCSTCGRGVCRACATVMGGKLYCKADLEKLALKGATQEQKRGRPLTFASVFAYAVGLGGMVAGFVFIIIGILGESGVNSPLMSSMQPIFKYFSGLSASPGPLLIDLGLLILILGSVDVGAGYYLWQRSRWAGIGTLAVSIAAAVLVLAYLGTSSTPGFIASAYLVTAIVKASCLAAGWKNLK
jgi:hypothetical protein